MYKDPDDCIPSKPVAVLQIHGTQDEQVHVDGGTLGDNPPKAYPSALESLDDWAGYDGCTGELVLTPETLDLDRTLQGANGPNETSVSGFEGCPAGISLELWSIDGADHSPDWTDGFGGLVIDYLLDHEKPA